MSLKALQDRVLARLYLKRDYETVFKTPEGERVLAHILRVSGATHPRFNSEPLVTAHNEGQRHLAMSIFRQVHSSTDKLPSYITEEMKRLEAEAEQIET